MSGVDKRHVHHTSEVSFLRTGILIAVVMLLAILTVGVFIPAIFGADSGQDNIPDPAESEDDLNVEPVVDTAISGMLFTKSVLTQLEHPTACISPVAPPPKDS